MFGYILRTLVATCLVFVNSADSYDYCGYQIPRHDWGAVGPVGGDVMQKPVDIIIFHHTVTPYCTDREDCKDQLRNIQNFHKTTFGFADIGYNFVVGGDGYIYEGRGWDHVGAHTKDQNSKSYGIALVGDYTQKQPPEQMLKSIRNLIICGTRNGYISSDYGLYGGKDFRCTESPGKMVYESLKSFVKWHGKGEFSQSC